MLRPCFSDAYIYIYIYIYILCINVQFKFSKFLNGFFEERCLEWKNCVGVCTDGTACLTGRKSGLVTKIKDMAGNNL